MSGILLACNEKSTVAILSKLLKTEGYKVVSEEVVEQALGKIKSDDFDLIITLAGGAWDADLSFLRQARSVASDVPVIVIAERKDADLSAKIAQFQPYETIEKPLKIDVLLSTVQKAIDYKGTQTTKDINLNLQLEKTYQFENIVAESPAMKSVCEMVSRVSGADVTLFIVGESGTGKTALAMTVHANSRRKTKPFVAVDCSVPTSVEQLFGVAGKISAIENANGATLFLDQVDKLARDDQDKLYKILSERKLKSTDGKDVFLDLRIIAASSPDIDARANSGEYNKDLYKLLKVIFVRIPPLRDRREDIIPTIRQVMTKILAGKSVLPVIDQKAVDVLEKYPWPGNSKEMETVLTAVLNASNGGKITIDILPANLKSIT